MGTPITDPTVVNWLNVYGRPTCDRICQMMDEINAAQGSFSNKGLASLCPNDATAVIEDGSGTTADPRTPCTGADVNTLIGLLATLQGMATGQNSVMPTLLKMAVNP